MTYSMNEIEAMAKRAARGAGYTWGLAEEAAFSTRWLCNHGLDGIDALARLLLRGLAYKGDFHRPDNIEGPWQCSSTLCPISTGAILSDHAELLKTRPLELHNILSPELLLYFSANVARRLNTNIAVRCAGLNAVTDGKNLFLGDEFVRSDTEPVSKVTVTRTDTISILRNHCSRANPQAAQWNILTQYAHKTYAPATEESRKLGAGADLIDND